MEELPENWLDKIFECMEKFYTDRWTGKFKNKFEIDLHKQVWFDGLNGLSYKEIKTGLIVCLKESKNKESKPPNVVRFHCYCIKAIYPNVPRGTFNEYKNKK